MLNLLFLTLSLLLSDQPGGKISGRIVNSETTSSVSSATVFLSDEDSPVSSVRTNQSGNFSFTNLQPGIYKLNIKKNGFSEFVRMVRINENFTLRIQIPLIPAGINPKQLAENEKKATLLESTPLSKVIPEVNSTLLPQLPDTLGDAIPVATKEMEDSILVVDFPENPPLPVGGLGSIIRNVEYPELAKRMGIEGKVVVRVTVNEKGEATQVDILKRANSVLNEAAIYTIYKSRFTPAQHRGKNVISQITLPIQFSLK
ncbi:TonB family protein [Accumulibacter sp.]|uniref:TonB family protein n=1 Tax=Accumulibacter sp. TaxID=2053492 RepID=UPI001ACF2088|nr:TonB family protein [Accumulibacter sp.]MBN8498165.1 TonB family protein [Accumulibacter sp.]MBN8707351.1 TonB family protein [Bacteroidota bacterium]